MISGPVPKICAWFNGPVPKNPSKALADEANNGPVPKFCARFKGPVPNELFEGPGRRNALTVPPLPLWQELDGLGVASKTALLP